MNLTDADGAAINAADTFTAAYLAGKRAGAEAMRERAEQACGDAADEFADDSWNHATDACAAAIRALGVDDE